MNTKKVIVPIIISVATLILLTVGATYAYFSVNTTNNFGTKTITTSAESIGNVALSTGNNLILDLSAKDMMNQGSDLAYYASSDGTTTTPTIEKIGTATVTGEGIYNCTYKLTMDDNNNSMYDVFQGMSNKAAGQIILTVNGIEYDFNTSGLFSKEISGTMYGITSEEARDITASLKIVNKTSVDQSALAGSNITITFSATSFECNAVEERLPSAYQEVEYLKSSGTQYIDTGITTTNINSFLVDYQVTDLDSMSSTIYGGRQSGNSGSMQSNQLHYVKSTQTIQFAFGNSGTATYSSDVERHVAYTNKNKLYIDNELVYTVDLVDITYRNNIYLFATNNAGTASFFSNAKIYLFNLYNNDTLVRHMIPCYRKSDNVRGMYDLVENKFYVNKGTGTFEIGSEI